MCFIKKTSNYILVLYFRVYSKRNPSSGYLLVQCLTKITRAQNAHNKYEKKKNKNKYNRIIIDKYF